MKNLVIILVLLISGTFYGQSNPYGMVRVDYNLTYDRDILTNMRNSTININDVRFTPNSNNVNVFVRENFGQINIIYRLNHIDLPKSNVDNNVREYDKLNSFNPDKTLREILRDDKR